MIQEDVDTLLRQHPPLKEAVSPLVTLAQVQPTQSTLEAIISLVMAMGIHAAAKRIDRDIQVNNTSVRNPRW